MKLGETEEAFLSIVILCLIIAALFISAVVAIPVGIGAGIFYWFYKWHKRSQEPILLNLLKEQVEAIEPVTPVDVCNRCYDVLNYDIDLDYAVREIYEWEQLGQPPKFPQALTPIEVARYRDQAARYINNAGHEDFVPALCEAIRPLVVPSRRGIFKATRIISKEEVEYIAFRFNHPKYFKQLYQRLLANRESAKEPFDFIKGTPLEYIYERETAIELKNRFEHTHILAGTGAGKTQLIQYLISKDLEEDCTIIVIDNQRQMIPKLAALGIDMQYLSPAYPLALNLFDMPRSHTTAPLLQYVLSGLMNAPLTAKQELIFQFATTVLVANKGNITDFHKMLDGEVPDTHNVDETTRHFIDTQFFDRQYQQTRQEISWRVWSLLKNPTLRDMFTAPENRCALELNRKLILIDTDVDILQDYSGLFGRFFIAQLLQVAQERFKGHHRPVYVYIDEAYSYLDTSIVSMLETARKAKMGLILAHQYLGQVTEPKIAAALMSLTSTKYASQLSPSDAYTMAQAMRVKPDFIQNQKPLHFALWQKGNETVSIEVPVGVIEKMDTHPIPEDDMVARYCRQTPPPLPEQPPEPPKPTIAPDVTQVEEAGDW